MPQHVVREVASPQQLAKLQKYTISSFVETSRALTWCPAPGGPHLHAPSPWTYVTAMLELSGQHFTACRQWDIAGCCMIAIL